MTVERASVVSARVASISRRATDAESIPAPAPRETAVAVWPPDRGAGVQTMRLAMSFLRRCGGERRRDERERARTSFCSTSMAARDNCGSEEWRQARARKMRVLSSDVGIVRTAKELPRRAPVRSSKSVELLQHRADRPVWLSDFQWPAMPFDRAGIHPLLVSPSLGQA